MLSCLQEVLWLGNITNQSMSDQPCAVCKAYYNPKDPLPLGTHFVSELGWVCDECNTHCNSAQEQLSKTDGIARFASGGGKNSSPKK